MSQNADNLKVTCDGCGWRGRVRNLKDKYPESDDPQSPLMCPLCDCIGWTLD